MTNATAAGTAFGSLEASPAAEMAAFDSLAPELRELLNYSTLDYSAAQLARLRAGGTRQLGAVVIETPDERGSVVAKIQAMNDAHGGAIARNVSRETVRRDVSVSRSRRVLRRFR